MTESYCPLIEAPADGGFSTVNVVTLQEQIHAAEITHVKTKQGKIWKIFSLLNKKSVPLNNGGDGPQRVNFSSVESFGVLETPEEVTTHAGVGKDDLVDIIQDVSDNVGGLTIRVNPAPGGPGAVTSRLIDAAEKAGVYEDPVPPAVDASGTTYGQHLKKVIDGTAAPGTWTPHTPEAPAEAPAAHSDREHAILSASGAHRWINCPPSALLEAALPDSSSDAADQGTAAHELAEHKIRRALKQRSDRPTSPHQDDEMEELTDAYRDWILTEYTTAQALTNDAQLFLEQRVDFSTYVNDGFGTADAVIIGDGTMQVIDLKYGAGVQVDATGNPQGRLYALGALALFDVLYDIREVVITIYQPRRDNISSETLTVEELHDWATSVVQPAAALAAAGQGDFAAGEWCGFCKIKHTCRARAEKNLEIAQWEFDPPVELTDEEITEALRLIPEARAWMNDLEKFASEQAVNQGKQWPGFKLVEGRSNRTYLDDDKVAAAAAAAGYTDVWDRKLIGITAMEKLMGKQTFAEVLDGLVIKPEGKPKLVPESDHRPPIASRSAVDDFGGDAA